MMLLQKKGILIQEVARLILCRMFEVKMLLILLRDAGDHDVLG